MASPLILALPKGRILKEALPILQKMDIEPEKSFFDPENRSLRFSTNRPELDIIRVRSFDVATFVAFGAASMGISGSDVLQEFGYADIYAPVDLGIGKCRLSVAEPMELAMADDPQTWSYVKIASKYPNLTRRHFAERGVQAELINLSGAMELAPQLGLARYIVDLVASGATLKAARLVEIEKIMDVSAKLIVNRSVYKNEGQTVRRWLELFGA